MRRRRTVARQLTFHLDVDYRLPRLADWLARVRDSPFFASSATDRNANSGVKELRPERDRPLFRNTARRSCARAGDAFSRHMAAYVNLLEPEALVRAFLTHAPIGARAVAAPQGTPAFATRFDLLTTADDTLKRFLGGLPLKRYWSRVLHPMACFVGTTVSEYALLPEAVAPYVLVSEIKDRLGNDYPFLIFKDLPENSPLLDTASNALAQAVVDACVAAGFVVLQGQALAYVPIDFASVESFIGRLSRGRRKDVRRKLRASAELGITIEVVPCGSDGFRCKEVLDEYYAMYMNVFRQSEVHFDLLSAEFFRAMLQDAAGGGVVFEYRQGGRLIAYNICFVTADMLIDKYVGFRYPEAREANLYFVSWFHNLAFAQERGLRWYVAGWTDPTIKAYLGARFTFTRHAVYVRNGLLRALLRTLSRRFEADRNWREKFGEDSTRRP